MAEIPASRCILTDYLLIVDLAVGQTPRSTELISSFCLNPELKWFAVECIMI